MSLALNENLKTSYITVESLFFLYLRLVELDLIVEESYLFAIVFQGAFGCSFLCKLDYPNSNLDVMMPRKPPAFFRMDIDMQLIFRLVLNILQGVVFDEYFLETVIPG